MTALKIAGEMFEIADKYAEGHNVSVNEANALNAVRRENIRNNQAKFIKANQELEKPESAKKMQNLIDKYAETYEFGLRAVREAVDPVTKVALRLARAAVRQTLKDNDLSKNEDYGKEWVEEKANAVIETQPYFREEAQRQVDAAKAQASIDLGLD